MISSLLLSVVPQNIFYYWYKKGIFLESFIIYIKYCTYTSLIPLNDPLSEQAEWHEDQTVPLGDEFCQRHLQSML